MLSLPWCLLLYSFWPTETLASSGYCVVLVSQWPLKCFYTDLLDTSIVDSWCWTDTTCVDGQKYRAGHLEQSEMARCQVHLFRLVLCDWSIHSFIHSFVHILGILQCCGQGLSEILWRTVTQYLEWNRCWVDGSLYFMLFPVHWVPLLFQAWGQTWEETVY